jgi:hypothetical protein
MHLEELLEEAKRKAVDKVFSEPIDFNEPTPTSKAKKRKNTALPPLKDCELAHFIEPTLMEKFLSIERQLHVQREKWLSGEGKIDCAGFLQALFEKRFFTGPKPRRGSSVNYEIVRAFAWWQYGLDLSVQLSPQKTRERTERYHRYLNRSIW